jgi:hypothetical protein
MEITWDEVGKRFYETGVDHGVLYLPDPATGVYTNGVPWNGLTGITQSPSGAESNKQYADNIVYLNLISAEEFGATLEAMTYPPEFDEFDGKSGPVAGLLFHQQNRRPFGLSWRSLVGNDLEGNDHAYKIHLAYGLQAAPSEQANTTVNDSPEPVGFSWELSSTPVAVGTIAGKFYKPTAKITVDSREFTLVQMAALEEVLYGNDGVDPDPGVAPRLPLPAEVYSILDGAAA